MAEYHAIMFTEGEVILNRRVRIMYVSNTKKSIVHDQICKMRNLQACLC